jgi:hypothetical protein
MIGITQKMSGTSYSNNKFFTLTIIILLWQLAWTRSQHDKKRKNVNNTMPIIIEFIENNKFRIQIWIMKITYNFYIHKNHRTQIIKSSKNQRVQNAKTETTNRTLNLNVG